MSLPVKVAPRSGPFPRQPLAPVTEGLQQGDPSICTLLGLTLLQDRGQFWILPHEMKVTVYKVRCEARDMTMGFLSLRQLLPCPRTARAIGQYAPEVVVKEKLSPATPQREAESNSIRALSPTTEAGEAPSLRNVPRGAVLQPLATEWEHLQALLESILLSKPRAAAEPPTPTFGSVTTAACSPNTCFAHDALAFLVALNSHSHALASIFESDPLQLYYL